MTTAKELRDELERKLEELRKFCPHDEVSDWMDYMWAPGHFAGQVRICKRCEKILEESPQPRSSATTTIEFTTEEVKDGD